MGTIKNHFLVNFKGVIMYTFLPAHGWWAALCIGVIRGIRRGWRVGVVTLRSEKLKDEVTHVDGYPIEEHPDYIALTNAQETVIKRIRNGKRYSNISEVYSDFETELKFQRIALRIGL